MDSSDLSTSCDSNRSYRSNRSKRSKRSKRSNRRYDSYDSKDSYDSCDSSYDSYDIENSLEYHNVATSPLMYATWNDFESKSESDTSSSCDSDDSSYVDDSSDADILDDELDAAIDELIYYLEDPNAVDELKFAYENVKRIAEETGNETVLALFCSSPSSNKDAKDDKNVSSKIPRSSFARANMILPDYPQQNGELKLHKSEGFLFDGKQSDVKPIDSDLRSTDRDRIIDVSNRLHAQETENHYPKYTFFAGTLQPQSKLRTGDELSLLHSNPDYLEHHQGQKNTFDRAEPVVLFTKLQKDAVKWGSFNWNDQTDLEILSIWKHLMEGMKLMNMANVIHGDLRDNNVILVKTNKWIPKIIDYGASEYIEEDHLFDYDSPAEDFWLLHTTQAGDTSRDTSDTAGHTDVYQPTYKRLINELKLYMKQHKMNLNSFNDLIKAIDNFILIKTR